MSSQAPIAASIFIISIIKKKYGFEKLLGIFDLFKSIHYGDSKATVEESNGTKRKFILIFGARESFLIHDHCGKAHSDPN